MPREVVPILDYAGPRNLGRTRLPARSQLDCVEFGNTLKITETLRGRQLAIVALVLAGVTLITLGLRAAGFALQTRWNHAHEVEVVIVAAMAGLWVTELVVTILVIRNTWRKTILLVTPGHLRLTFCSVLGTREHQWEVDGATALITPQQLDPSRYEIDDPAAELCIQPAPRVVVKLFTGHGLRELTALAARIQATLKLGAA